MSVTCVVAQKGGTGKSTFCQNLAAIRAALNYRCVILDLDGQETSQAWVEERSVLADVQRIEGRTLKHLLEADLVEEFGALLADAVDGYTDVFIDVGGKDTRLARAALAAGDAIVVPLKPSPADLRTVPALYAALESLTKTLGRGINAQVVLNEADPRKRLTKVMIREMEQFSDLLPRCNTLVGSRESFKLAMAQGRGVCEMAGEDFDAKAAHEIKSVYLEVYGK